MSRTFAHRKVYYTDQGASHNIPRWKVNKHWPARPSESIEHRRKNRIIRHARIDEEGTAFANAIAEAKRLMWSW